MLHRLSEIVVVCLGVFLLSGCISTRVTSLVDPLYRDSSYGRILVVADYPQLEMTQKMEKRMVLGLRDSGLFAVANSDLLPPLRKYSDSEVTVIYAKYKLDACLIISPIGQKSESFYHPGWTHINNDVSVDRGFGSFGDRTTVKTSVHSSPGSTEKVSYIDTKAELRDIRTGAIVSRCDANTEQTSYNTVGGSTDQLIGSITEKMIGEFKRNRLLRRK